METIMVVDDMAIFREPIAASLRLAGFATICAVDGRDALQKISLTQPDLILLDIAMPVMDGLTLLKLLRSDPKTYSIPVIMLTALAEKDKVVQASKLSIQDYLLKSRFSIVELLERVRKHLPSPAYQVSSPSTNLAMASSDAPAIAHHPAPKTMSYLGTTDQPSPRVLQRPWHDESKTNSTNHIPSLLTREQCLKRTKDALHGRALSGIVARVIAEAGSPWTGALDLAELISKDSVLSARILQVANSAAYKTSRKTVTSVNDAVKQIGCASVRNLAAALGVFDAMPTPESDGFNVIRGWQHSFGVATLCEHLAVGLGGELASAAFLTGLCHDLGEILFRSHFGAEYQQVLDFHHRTGLEVATLERKMLGITRGDMTKHIFKSLALPSLIQDPIEVFHRGDQLIGDGSHQLARVLRLAESYANAMLLASGSAGSVQPFTTAECRLATGMDVPNLPDAADLRSEVLRLTAVFARLDSHEHAPLLRPIVGQSETPVLVYRDPALSASDPITILFQSLAQAQVLRRPPVDAFPIGDAKLLVLACRSTGIAGFSDTEITRLLGRKIVPVLRITQHPSDAEDAASDTINSTIAPISIQAAVDILDRCAKSDNSQARSAA